MTQLIPVTISTITPVHIGCGEDYEPTGYVFDGDVLYPFQPDSSLMGKIHGSLGFSPTLQSVSMAFSSKLQDCKLLARHYVPANKGIGSLIARDLSQGRFPKAIERTFYHPYTQFPVLPGSSLKGAIRTAILNRLAAEGPARLSDSTMESTLLGGSFENDPLRLFALADAHCTAGSEEATHVANKHGRHRDNGTPISVGDHKQNYFECIKGFLPDSFRTELRFSNKVHSTQDRNVTNFDWLRDACNAHYRRMLQDEIRILKQCGLPQAAATLSSILDVVLTSRTGFLLQVGKYAGADTLVVDRYKGILGKKYKTPLPLSIHYCSINGNMQPLGWVWVESNPQDDRVLPLLRRLAASQADPAMKTRQAEFRKLQEQQQEAKAAASALKARQAEEQAVRAAAAEVERQAEVARAERMATMTPQMQQVENLREKLAARVGQKKQAVGGEIYGLLQTELKSAAAPEWQATEREALIAVVEEYGPQLIALDPKELRKKFKPLTEALRV